MKGSGRRKEQMSRAGDVKRFSRRAVATETRRLFPEMEVGRFGHAPFSSHDVNGLPKALTACLGFDLRAALLGTQGNESGQFLLDDCPSRSWLRTRAIGPAMEILVADENDKENPRIGWVTDRSTSGLCLLLSEPVYEGTVLHILPNNATSTTPWSQVQVKNCRQNGINWEVGCEWVQVPTWGVMLQFG